MKPTLLLINPWIYDFAAYDLWAKPLGLLCLASQLRRMGLQVHLVDCLDIYNPHMEKMGHERKPARRRYGTGKFWKRRVRTPSQLPAIQRPYSRYGIDPHIVITELKKVKRPAAILITSLLDMFSKKNFEKK